MIGEPWYLTQGYDEPCGDSCRWCGQSKEDCSHPDWVSEADEDSEVCEDCERLEENCECVQCSTCDAWLDKDAENIGQCLDCLEEESNDDE